MHPCLQPGCPVLTDKPRCPQHTAKKQWPAKNTRQPGAYDTEYLRNRRIVLEGDPLCYCGCGRPATTADHITPRALGGGNELANLRPAASTCNYARGGRTRST